MQEIILRCEKASEIYLYGAGAIANLTYFNIKKSGYVDKVKGFLVSNETSSTVTKNGLLVQCYKSVELNAADRLVIVATQESVQREISQNLELVGVKNYLCVDSDCIVNEFYRSFYEQPVQKNKILFLHMKGLGYGGNPKYIADKIIELDKDEKVDIVWAVSKDGYSFPDRIRTVKFESEEYYYELATASVWVDNSRKTSEIRKREGQYYVQAWHGAAPIKKVEKDVENKLSVTYISNAIHDSELADLFISGSRFYSELYRKSFWYDGEIMEVGLPRQDIFFADNAIKKKIRDYYKIDSEYEIALYAPTFRKDKDNRYYDLDVNSVKHALEKRFRKKYVMCISKHPDIRDLKYESIKGEYIDVGEYEDFEELLVASDILISDYSGCVYDYSFSKRPVFLYQPDYEEYILDRDFYFSMDELPYIQAFSNEGLVDKILSFDEASYRNCLDDFMDSMGNFDDGTASEKVAKIILSKMK